MIYPMTRRRDVDVAIGATIHQHMWMRSISQREVADTLGVAQNSVSRRLRGTTPITVGELHALADLLHVSVEDLITMKAPAALVATGASGGYGIRDLNPEPAALKDYTSDLQRCWVLAA